jgi:DNA-binding response OmpR family regulator
MSFLGPPKRILVIDDEEGIVEYIRILLRTRGYESIPAHDGEEGLALLQSEQLDLVITDLRMPKMSGLELMRRRRELPPDIASIPFLVISSMGAEQDKPESFWIEGLGCDDFLSKPFEALTLLARVEALLRREKYRKTETPPPSSGNNRRSATPNPATATPPPGGQKSSRPVRREFTVQLAEGASPVTNSPAPPRPIVTTEPVEVVRASILAGHGLDECLAHSSVLDGVVLPSVQSRILDATTLIQTDTEAEIAILREDVGSQTMSDPVAYDERYRLTRGPRGWVINSIRQERLIPEL